MMEQFTIKWDLVLRVNWQWCSSVSLSVQFCQLVML